MHNFRSNFPSSLSPSLFPIRCFVTHIFPFLSLFVSCVPFVAITIVIDYKLSHLSACLTRANISAFNENKSQLGFVCISCVSTASCCFFRFCVKQMKVSWRHLLWKVCVFSRPTFFYIIWKIVHYKFINANLMKSSVKRNGVTSSKRGSGEECRNWARGRGRRDEIL